LGVQSTNTAYSSHYKSGLLVANIVLVYEMREHFGAGYRMYYIRRGAVVIVMLGGGDKSSQSRDIEQALQLAQTLED